MTVPTNVGAPPISPSRPRKRQVGSVGSLESGPTIPNPSVALCSAKPMIRTSASETSPAAAD